MLKIWTISASSRHNYLGITSGSNFLRFHRLYSDLKVGLLNKLALYRSSTQLIITSIYNLGYKRMCLPPCEVVDAPSRIQGDHIWECFLANRLTSLMSQISNCMVNTEKFGCLPMTVFIQPSTQSIYPVVSSQIACHLEKIGLWWEGTSGRFYEVYPQ